MPNRFKSNVWFVDTPSATAITTETMTIRAMKWISGNGAQGDVAVLQDASGSPIWQGICSGPGFDTGIFDLGGLRTIQGMLVPTLTSGQLYFYL